jgi:hypothetical protein
MRIIKHLLIGLMLIMQFACEDWMNLIPPEGLIRDEFWKTKEEVAAVLMGAYETFSRMDGSLFKYGEMRGDMVVRDNNLSEDEQKIMEGNIYPENEMCKWEEFYKVINYCNEIIKNAPAVQELDNTFTDYQLQGYVSEAKFLRGLSYFYLVRIFRDVPFILEPSISDDSEFYLPVANGDEILEYLIEDLNNARQFATTDGYQTLQELKGRATKAAFDALLADISLWVFDYEECIRHADKILSSIDYDLMPSARWFELFYPGNAIESIFEFQFDNSRSQNNSTYGLTSRTSYNYDPSETAIQLFAKEYARELYRGEDSSIKKYGDEDFIIWKYVGRAGDGTSTRAGFEQYSCNWIVYRLADVMLMKAEALSQLERYQEALDLINEVRIRADVSVLSLPESKVAYEDAILEERALELAFEGKRWYDLLRMGRRNNFSRKSKLIEAIVKNVPATQKRILAVKLTNTSGWYLPIYEEELERNKNLVHNPYYKY